MKKIIILTSAFLLLVTAACKKDKTTTPTTAEPKLIFVFDFDSTQVRLDGFGQPTTMAAGHAGQNPKMNGMSAHYIELSPGAWTPVGSGTVVYKAAETTQGGENAIDFSKAVVGGKGFKFFEVPLKNVAAGEYEYLRVSLGYQNFDVKYYIDSVIDVPNVGTVHIAQEFPATVASFVGFNNFITSYKIKTETVTVNSNKKQGYWGFESKSSYNGFPFNYSTTGQAPAGATTVVNPLASSSPIPAGSCLATGKFPTGKLKITGTETKDIIIRVSLSTNKSFEWTEVVQDGKWEPAKGENIVDMGLRGLIPFIEE